MKKWLLLCLMLLMSMALFACGSDDEKQTVVLQAEENGIVLKITYVAEGDKVIEQSAENIIPYAALGVETIEEAEEIISDLAAGYEDAKGITHKLVYEEDRVIETLTVNMEEVDHEELSELTGVITDGDTSNGISLEKSVELLEEQGFEVVE